MDTTTTEDGATPVAQPTTNVAGTDDGAMVITTDESGTPTMVPVSEADTEAENAASTQDETTEEPTGSTEAVADATQATDDSQEIVEWAKKKGLEINPENPNEVKLAKLQLDNDRRFHESQQNKPQIAPPELMDNVDDPTLNAIVEKQNVNETRLYVRDWFEANPEMKEHRQDLMQIATERPYLVDMEDVAAHLYRRPDFVSNLKSEGGRHALENLAQKQSAVPPQASSSNTAVYASDTTITSKNVAQLVDSNDQAWFEKNHDEISKALAG
ncbi:hypothetical protein H0W80_01090 [Candidatus Saccharibacteria bacterium]|nr:hypothetical protein [Candidatus Saccharibacteria bacterium]